MEIPLLKEIAIVFGLSIIVLLICDRLRIPTLIAFVLTGILSGPYGFKFIASPYEVEALARIGLILLLFSIGMECSKQDISSLKKPFLLGGFFQVSLTILTGLAIGQFLGRPFGESIFLGCLLSLSSTAIVLKILNDKGEENSPHGRIALAILIFQDLISIPMVFLIPALGVHDTSVSFLTLAMQLAKGFVILISVYLAACKIVPFLFYYIAKSRSREIFILFIMAICLLTTWIAGEVGLPIAIGAFLAGLILSDTDYKEEARELILPFQDVFTNFFFISIGMLVNINFLLENMVLICLVTTSVILIKIVIASFSTGLLGMPLRTVLLAGLSLGQIGEFSFVLIKEGFEYSLETPYYYQLFLSVSLLSMTLTPLLIGIAGRVVDQVCLLPLPRKIKEGFHSELHKPHFDERKNHVIIVGFGMIGRMLALTCKKSLVDYCILEMNPKTVREEKKNSQPIYFGDASHKKILSHLHIVDAKVIAIAVSDPLAAKHIVKNARFLNPDIYIIVRARFLSEVKLLQNLGANDVVVDEQEASRQIFSFVLSRCAVSQEKIEALST